MFLNNYSNEVYKMTKIAIPIIEANGRETVPGGHFGRSPTFYIVNDVEDESKDELLSNSSNHFGGKGLPADMLEQAGVKVIITTGMGMRAIRLLEEKGIAVYSTGIESISTIIGKYKEGTLNVLSEGCSDAKHA